MTLNDPGSLSAKSKNILEKVQESIYHEPRIPFAFLFGSYADGRETILSDIDIAIYFNGLDEDEKTEYEHRLWLLFDEQVNILRLEDEDISPLVRLKAVEGIPITIRDEDFLNRFILSQIHRASEVERVIGRLYKIR